MQENPPEKGLSKSVMVSVNQGTEGSGHPTIAVKILIVTYSLLTEQNP